MKTAHKECILRPTVWQPAAVVPYILAVHHALNGRPPHRLPGHTASEAYHYQHHVCLTKRERLAFFEWMHVHAKYRINQLEKIDQRSVLVAWLRCQNLITVYK